MNESDPILPFDPDPSAPDTELPLTPGQTPARESPRVRLGRETVVGVQTLLSAAVYATLIVTFVVQVARVDGMSMAPTLEDHDRLIVNKLVYELGEPRPGDIVMLYYPLNPEKMFVKRVIAKEGDTDF
jgi:signal peptidase I